MNRRSIPGAFICVLALIGFSACELSEDVLPQEAPEAPLPVVKDKGDRGLSIVAQTIALPEDQDIDETLLAGSNEGQILIEWEKVEQNGTIDYSQLDPVMDKYADSQLPLTIVYNPISRNEVSIPADLASLSWDSDTLRDRFKNLLYKIYYRYPTVQVNRVIIGEEVDIYLGEDASAWDSYTRFFSFARAELKSYYGSNLKVGSSTSILSMSELATKNLAFALHNEADIISVSYFPRNRDFTFKSVLHVTRDMEYLSAMAGNKKVFMQECGYPSAVSCNSSQELQRQFVAEVFRGWDLYDNQLEGIHFTWLRDINDTEVSVILEESGMDESLYVSRYIDFLRTSGLKDNRSAKPAMSQLLLEADARGW